jgi:hypothetical protein
MRTIERIAYKFEELEPKLQQKVLDKNRDAFVKDNWWDCVECDWIQILCEKGFNNAKISFSGFCSQGDGASFRAELDLSFILKGFADYQELLKPEYCLKAIVNLKERNGYYFDYKIKLEIESEDEKLIELLYMCECDLNALYFDLCREIYKSFNDEYDCLTSDEYLINIYKENDIEFWKNGDQI